MNLDEQFLTFFPVVINGISDMEKLALEMKEYAKSHVFDYTETANKIKEIPNLTTEQVGPMIKVKGYDAKIIWPWQKMVTFDNGQTPPYQITYTEGPMKGVTYSRCQPWKILLDLRKENLFFRVYPHYNI